MRSWILGMQARLRRPSRRGALLALAVLLVGALAWWLGPGRRVPPHRSVRVPGIPRSLSWSRGADRIAGCPGDTRLTWIWDLRDNHLAQIKDDPAIDTHMEIHSGTLSSFVWRETPLWSPTQSLLLLGNHVYDPDGHVLYDNHLPMVWGEPVWMPDGETMACQCREEWHVTTMSKLRLNGREAFSDPIYLPLSEMNCGYYPDLVAVSPEDSELALGSYAQAGYTVFLWNWKRRGKPEQIVGPSTWSRLHRAGDTQSHHLVFMKSGKVLVDATTNGEYRFSKDSEIFACDRATASVRYIARGTLLEASKTRDECAVWGDDGVRVINSRGWTLARLDDTGSCEKAVAWSPDGDQIAVGMGRTVRLYRIH